MLLKNVIFSFYLTLVTGRQNAAYQITNNLRLLIYIHLYTQTKQIDTLNRMYKTHFENLYMTKSEGRNLNKLQYFYC